MNKDNRGTTVREVNSTIDIQKLLYNLDNSEMHTPQAILEQ